MSRVTAGYTRRRRHNKILKQTKGYRGTRRNRYKAAAEALIKAGAYAYRDRRQKKREMRRLWIVRINAASREQGMKYSDLIDGLAKAGVEINRKMLAELALHDPSAFGKFVEIARGAN
jgi:large subunit ribosomal protein L20